MSRNNNVRGPTSALTDFLKASGITHLTVQRRVRTQNQTESQQVAESSSAPAAPARRGRPARDRRPSGYNSDDLDDPVGEPMQVDQEEENEEEQPTTKKRKLTKAAEAKLKAKEKKKRGKKGSDDDYDDEEDDPYSALSKSLWSNKSSKPAVGSFEDCAVCKTKFTVTKYTLAANSGDGYLCHKCAKAGGGDPFKKPAPRKRKPAADKRTVTHFQERRFPTLASMCIQLISENINDVDALGDIGTMNVEAISKALSKNRGMTPENVHLFYNATNTSLALFDATNLNSPALETLVYHNANLVSLRLDFCGCLDDKSFQVFAKSLPALERIELLGPFLVRSPAWQDFFKQHSNLQGFLITQSPRFDIDCAKVMVKHCPKLGELRLKEVGQMCDKFLDEIKKLKNVYSLDLSYPSTSCSETAVAKLLKAVGKKLTLLDLSKHDLLTDDFLVKSLAPNTTKLTSLTLEHLPEITDEGVGRFFNSWSGNAPLVSVDLSRNELLGSLALKGLLKHSGKAIEQLNINGWKETGEKELKSIAHLAVELKKLDVGWCRAVDDFVVKAWLQGETKNGVVEGGCKNLQEIKVWGCNRVGADCPKKRGVIIHGIEVHTVR